MSSSIHCVVQLTHILYFTRTLNAWRSLLHLNKHKIINRWSERVGRGEGREEGEGNVSHKKTILNTEPSEFTVATANSSKVHAENCVFLSAVYFFKPLINEPINYRISQCALLAFALMNISSWMIMASTIFVKHLSTTFPDVVVCCWQKQIFGMLPTALSIIRSRSDNPHWSLIEKLGTSKTLTFFTHSRVIFCSIFLKSILYTRICIIFLSWAMQSFLCVESVDYEPHLPVFPVFVRWCSWTAYSAQSFWANLRD